MIKIYRDSKEFPLYNYERISTTSDYFYMIKGYEYGDIIDATQEEMQEKFNEVVRDYVVSLNSKNHDIVLHGNINSKKLELLKFSMVRDIIILQIRTNDLKGTVNLELIKELLEGLKIKKVEDLHEQIKIIDGKIEKLKNDISESLGKLEKEDVKVTEESDINDIITNVELILERGIDMQKTSLYRFGIMQDQAVKKIEQQNKK